MESVSFSGVRNDQKTKKPRSVGGSIAAVTAGSVISSAATMANSLTVTKGMQKIGQLPNDTIELLHNCAEKALDISGMKAKGVKIEYVKESAKKLSPLQLLKASPNTQIANGVNAGFVPEIKTVLGNLGNKILMPEKGISFASFHEIGHSINYHNSSFWRTMQKLRNPGMALAALPLLYGAFSRQSVAKDGKELTKGQKVNNFIRNNAGKLSFAAMLPMLAEEAMATIRGQKLANVLLDKNLAKTVLKGNSVAYLSYLGAAVATGLGAFAAVKIKDHFVNKKAAKIAAQNQQSTAQKAA